MLFSVDQSFSPAHMERDAWGRRERPGLSQGVCAGALAVAGGCVGIAQRRFGAASRALGKCVPVLFFLLGETQPLLRRGVSSQMVLGDVLVLEVKTSGAAPL